MFKKIIAATIGSAIVVAIGSSVAIKAQPSIENYYPKTTEVVALDHENDLVILEDFNGFRWSFAGIEDWEIGDIASLIMDNMGTEIIFDDEIISVQYSGYYQAAEIR